MEPLTLIKNRTLKSKLLAELETLRFTREIGSGSSGKKEQLRRILQAWPDTGPLRAGRLRGFLDVAERLRPGWPDEKVSPEIADLRRFLDPKIDPRALVTAAKAGQLKLPHYAPDGPPPPDPVEVTWWVRTKRTQFDEFDNIIPINDAVWSDWESLETVGDYSSPILYFMSALAGEYFAIEVYQDEATWHPGSLFWRRFENSTTGPFETEVVLPDGGFYAADWLVNGSNSVTQQMYWRWVPSE